MGEGAERHTRRKQKVSREKRVLDVDRVVRIFGAQADERLGDTIGHAARPRERALAHVLRERASPDSSTQGSRQSVGPDQSGALHATVGLVRDEWVGAGDLSQDGGVRDPKGGADASREEGEVETPAGRRAELLPRVLGCCCERGSGCQNERHCGERSHPSEDAVLHGRHHRSKWLVATNGRPHNGRPSRCRGKAGCRIGQLQDARRLGLSALGGHEIFLLDGPTPSQEAAAVWRADCGGSDRACEDEQHSWHHHAWYRKR